MGLFDCLVVSMVAGELLVVVVSVVGERECVAKTQDSVVVREAADCG